MNGLRVALPAITIAVMAGSLAGKTRRESVSAPMLSIHLYDRAQVSAEVLRLATMEASRLFRAAGIQITWERLSLEAPEDEGTDMTSTAFAKADERAYLVVRLIRRVGGTILPGALGLSLPLANTGAHVLIFYDRVEALTRGVNTPTYVILGHAMAHEIGHVLLGSSDHSNGGLMQGSWTAASWRLASAGLLAFRRQEAELMCTRLARVQGRHRPGWPRSSASALRIR